MPFIPLIVAALTPALGVVGATAVGVALTIGISVGLYFGAKALTPKPSDFDKGARTIMMRAPSEPHRWIYGTLTVSGRLYVPDDSL